MNGRMGGAQSEATHRAAATPAADPGARSSSAVRGKRWATAKELTALLGIVLGAVGVLLGGMQWAVSSALETTLTFAVSPLREDLRLVQEDVRLVREDVRSLSEGQAEIRGQLAKQGAEVSALREEVRSVRAEVRSLSEGQAETRGQLARQGAEVSALREEMRSVRADVRALGEGQAELGERLVRVETLLELDGSSSAGDRHAGDASS